MHAGVNATEVWLLGGPADGRIEIVEHDADGRLPVMLRLTQAGLYVGVVDASTPVVEHRYRRGGDLDGQPVYEYTGDDHLTQTHPPQRQ